MDETRNQFIHIVRFGKEVMTEAQKATEAVLAEYGDALTGERKEIFDKVYNEWRGFKSRIRQWTRLNQIPLYD